MKVTFHPDFYDVYTSDPAAAAGRMEAIVETIKEEVDFIEAQPVTEQDLSLVHTKSYIDSVKRSGLYPIASLAAGGALQAARIALTEPAFALIRPPGHHASSNSAWGFCYFNNMAVAIEKLKHEKVIGSAFILDIDLHYGDGNVNILKKKDYVQISNIESDRRRTYMETVEHVLKKCQADIIAVSAGFDNHQEDWGGLLATEDYFTIGHLVRKAALRLGRGCFGILEGGYNHDVLGINVLAFIRGLATAGEGLF